jgi:hypothetical protein
MPERHKGRSRARRPRPGRMHAAHGHPRRIHSSPLLQGDSRRASFGQMPQDQQSPAPGRRRPARPLDGPRHAPANLPHPARTGQMRRHRPARRIVASRSVPAPPLPELPRSWPLASQSTQHLISPTRRNVANLFFLRIPMSLRMARVAAVHPHPSRAPIGVSAPRRKVAMTVRAGPAAAPPNWHGSRRGQLRAGDRRR